MDLSIAAAAYAQIVSLLADFTAQKSSKDMLSIQEFSEWLATHGHADVMRAIEQNQAMTVGVKAALAEGRTELLEKLRSLDEKITAVAAGLGPLDEIGRAIYPNAALSKQACDILRAFEQQQATEALESHRRGGPALILVGGTNSGLQFHAGEPRFYEDDLSLLIGLGLLSLSYNKSNGRVLRLTRLGSQIGKQLLGEQPK